MKGINIFLLCNAKKWSEARKYLSSDAAEEDKKSNVMYRNGYGETCFLLACYYGAPDDVIKAIIDIGGKELVMVINGFDRTVLHLACRYGRSYNIIKMLIEVGGKDLVMAKDEGGDTALHWLCYNSNDHHDADDKIKLILEVGDANLLLSTKGTDGQTPLTIATDKGTSNLIKKLLTVQSNSNSTTYNDSPSANIVPADNSTPITQSSQEQDTTQSSSTNNDLLTIPIRGLDIDQNYQSQLREAKEKAQTSQQDYDQKCIDYSDLEENYQKQLKDAKEQTMQIQQDYDQKCADCCHLKEVNQVENTEKLQWKDKMDNYMHICSEYKAKLQEMKDKASAPVADIQMIKQEEGEAAYANELEESNRRAADLEATVETQRLEIADLSSEKDGVEKSLKDEVDKLTRKLSKQHAELQLLKNSSSDVEVGMKRKHTNEEHERGRRRHNSGTVSNTIIKKEES